MANIEYRYPYNPKGDRSDCIINDELITIDSLKTKDYTYIILSNSPFFENGLSVFSLQLNRALVLNTDYILTHKFREASEALHKPIYGSITFLDSTLCGDVKVTYSTLGGEFTNRQREALVKIVYSMTAHRIVDWSDIEDIPISFTPSSHTHTPDHIMDMNAVVDAIDNIGDILLGDTRPNHRHTIDQIDNLSSILDTKVDNGNNTVFAPCEPIIAAGGTKAILLSLPKTNVPLWMRMELWISSGAFNTNLMIMALLEPDKNDTLEIKNLVAVSDNVLLTDKICGYYKQSIPVLGFSSTVGLWEQCIFTIPKVTYTALAKEHISGVYSIESATTLVGSIVDIVSNVDRKEYQSINDRLHRVKINTILNEVVYDII